MNFITNKSSEMIFNFFNYNYFSEDIQKPKKQIKRIDNTLLETLLKNCPNITTIRLFKSEDRSVVTDWSILS